MQSVLNPADYQSLVIRIGKLTNASAPLWGKMNVAQMLSHSSVAFEMALGLKPIKDKSNFLFRLLFKGTILGTKPFKKNLPTGKEFIITDARDFEREKKYLLEVMERAYKNGTNGKWHNHTLIGKLTAEEWGCTLYKHTDHHLGQFGV
jgi:hypothetical protein